MSAHKEFLRHMLKRGDDPRKEELVLEYKSQTMARRQEGQEQREECCYGILPARAPLANPYVPFQQNNPPTYAAKNGVVRGTLFPGLDLPFMGKVNTKPLSDCHLHELQTLGFAVVELGEYLDTHWDDTEAFELFRSYAELYKKGKEEYEKMHGPLTQMAAAMGEKYCWLTEPWPWEYEANCHKEG